MKTISFAKELLQHRQTLESAPVDLKTLQAEIIKMWRVLELFGGIIDRLMAGEKEDTAATKKEGGHER